MLECAEDVCLHVGVQFQWEQAVNFSLLSECTFLPCSLAMSPQFLMRLLSKENEIIDSKLRLFAKLTTNHKHEFQLSNNVSYQLLAQLPIPQLDLAGHL